ncbi:hypothetical protein ACFQV4_37555 [Streptomyces thermocarboxydus]
MTVGDAAAPAGAADDTAGAAPGPRRPRRTAPRAPRPTRRPGRTRRRR